MKKFTDQHEWVSIIGDIATMGITNFAQQQLGDVVYVEVPVIGKTFKQGQEMAVVESVKAASEVYAPLSGTITAVNDTLQANPEMVNQSAESDGWFVKMKINDTEELDKLMDLEQYKVLIG